MTFYLDHRTHGTDSLIVAGLDKFQGPALLSHNDAKFNAMDWENIQKPEQSGKEKDPFKVGKFGLGFNSVYHITGKCHNETMHTRGICLYNYICTCSYTVSACLYAKLGHDVYTKTHTS